MKPKSIKFVRMTIKEANKRLLFQLYHVYDNSEAANIADLVMENITGWKRIDRLVNSQVKLSAHMLQLLDKYTEELLTYMPVQYVLNEAWFCGLKLFVNNHVLIPRPETEELVAWALSISENTKIKILDIGTGSGCIPISIKNKLPAAIVYACDISQDALAVAEKNADIHQTKIFYLLSDILDREQWKNIPEMNMIISNPPYIPLKEKLMMNDNVVKHEPHVALFVNDDDPLVFYKAIAAFAEEKLLPGGNLFLETHEDLAAETALLFNKFSHAEIKKDMQGKQRMIRVS
jgi:release factor glutamine methyltransferase